MGKSPEESYNREYKQSININHNFTAIIGLSSSCSPAHLHFQLCPFCQQTLDSIKMAVLTSSMQSCLSVAFVIDTAVTTTAVEEVREGSHVAVGSSHHESFSRVGRDMGVKDTPKHL